MKLSVKISFIVLYITSIVILLSMIANNAYFGALIIIIFFMFPLTLIYSCFTKEVISAKDVEKLTEKHNFLIKKIDSKKNIIKKLNNKIKKKEGSYQELDNGLNTITDKLNSYKKEVNIFEEREKNIKQNQKELQKQNENIEKNIITDKEISEKISHLELLNKNLENVKVELDAKQALLNKIKDFIVEREIKRIDNEKDGHKFEKFLSKVLNDNGFKSYVTRGSGDHGADLIAEKDGLKYVKQAKCWTNSVSNKAVQEVFTAKKMYDADKAMVITNSNYTNSAIETALKCKVDLIDRKKFIKLLTNSIDNNIETYLDTSWLVLDNDF